MQNLLITPDGNQKICNIQIKPAIKPTTHEKVKLQHKILGKQVFNVHPKLRSEQTVLHPNLIKVQSNQVKRNKRASESGGTTI